MGTGVHAPRPWLECVSYRKEKNVKRKMLSWLLTLSLLVMYLSTSQSGEVYASQQMASGSEALIDPGGIPEEEEAETIIVELPESESLEPMMEVHPDAEIESIEEEEEPVVMEEGEEGEKLPLGLHYDADGNLVDDFGVVQSPMSAEAEAYMYGLESGDISVSDPPPVTRSSRAAIVIPLIVILAIAAVLSAMGMTGITEGYCKDIANKLETYKTMVAKNYTYTYRGIVYTKTVTGEMVTSLRDKIYALEHGEKFTLTEDDRAVLMYIVGGLYQGYVNGYHYTCITRDMVSLHKIEDYNYYAISAYAVLPTSLQVLAFKEKPDFAFAKDGLAGSSLKFCRRNYASATGYAQIDCIVSNYTYNREIETYVYNSGGDNVYTSLSDGFPLGHYDTGYFTNCLPFNILAYESNMENYLKYELPMLNLVANAGTVVPVGNIIDLSAEIAVPDKLTDITATNENLYTTKAGVNTKGFEVIEGGGSGGEDPEKPVVPPEDIKTISGLLTSILTALAAITGIPTLIEKVNDIFNKVTDLHSLISAIKDAVITFPADVAADIRDALSHVFDDIINSIDALPLDIAEAIARSLGWDTVADHIKSASNNLKSISDAVKSIPQTLVEIRDKITGFPAIEGLQDFLTSIPSTLVDIKNVITTIPDTLIEIKDGIVAIPGDIIDFFTIDTAAIGLSYADLQATFDGRFSAVKQLGAVFSDSGRTFDQAIPVITMGVPAPLKFAFPDKDEIIVMDLRPYAQWFSWARALLVAMLWLAFGKWVLDQFDVDFHIG